MRGENERKKKYLPNRDQDRQFICSFFGVDDVDDRFEFILHLPDDAVEGIRVGDGSAAVEAQALNWLETLVK